MDKGAQEESPREQYRLLHPTAWQGMDHLLLHPLPGQGPRDAHPLLFPPRQGPQHHLFHPLPPKQNALRREPKLPQPGDCKEQQQQLLEDQARLGRQLSQVIALESPGDYDKQRQEESDPQKLLQVKAEEQEQESQALPACSGGKKKRDNKAAANRRGGKEEGQALGSSCGKGAWELKVGKEEPEEIKKQEKLKENCDTKALGSDKEGAIKTELVEPPEEDCKGRECVASKPCTSSNGPAHGSKDASVSRPLGMQHPPELKIPVTLHPVPPGARIQFQGPPPSELLRMTKVPMAQVPLKMQSLLEPSVKIETKDVPLTVLPSDAGIR